MAEKTKKIVLKYLISGGYQIHGEDGEPSINVPYPEPLKEVSMDADIADNLLGSGAAYTPAEWAKHRKTRG